MLLFRGHTKNCNPYNTITHLDPLDTVLILHVQDIGMSAYTVVHNSTYVVCM